MVGDVTTTEGPVGSPEFVQLFVRFRATLHNRGRTEFRVASESPCVAGVERLSDTGEWKTILMSTCYDLDWIPRGACTAVRPGDRFEFPRVSANVVLRKDEKPQPAYVVVRFHVRSICKEGDRRHWQPLVTEAVKLSVPH
jgi:hypothetical protein